MLKPQRHAQLRVTHRAGSPIVKVAADKATGFSC